MPPDPSPPIEALPLLTADAPQTDATLAGGGEMGARMRAVDWSRTPLGPVAAWPQSLKTCVRVVLTSRQPMFVWWGAALTNLYNDAYKAIVGAKDAWALGQPASAVWREIWDQIGPRAASAMARNEGTYDEALLLIMERNGYPEETHYTFSYSPVPGDDGRPGGILCANTDDTQRIIDARQLALLQDLAARAADARSAQEACALSAAGLATNPADLPFALVYLTDPGDRSVSLAGAAGIGPDHPAAPARCELDEPCAWPFARALRDRDAAVVDDLPARFPSLPRGAWDRPPTRAAVIPIAGSGAAVPQGALVVGLNPYRRLDAGYLGFLGLAAGQVAANLAHAQALEAERRRAEALAEVDRAKTQFFSNVSHEFRTPLTLMLGPTEDALASDDRALRGAALETVHRNALRLLRLVNTLLDFSRVEAGRARVSYERTDLGALAADLASAFRSAIERAGLRLAVDVPAAPAWAWVDRAMFEKVALNLLSNALKFTFDGEISVSVRAEERHVELRVRDTGVGIPPGELPRLFERFHRVEGTRARTHEGSGIGLALAHELVALHGGDLRVESEPGRGSVFVARFPTGTAHLPPGRVGPSAPQGGPSLGAAPYVAEALRWLPAVDDVAPAALPEPPRDGARVLVADDNADMRDYLARLLRERWSVETVADGEAALAAARARPPDLILTDVMMPGLDGFGLLRALRVDAGTARVPVIMLSARAGAESRVDGLHAGADDYLVKPFSAKELIARVATHLEIARGARERERLLASEREARADAEAANRTKDEFLAMLGHELRNPLAPIVTALHLMRARAADVAVREREVIERQVDHLVHLVDDLLDVSRIARGNVELRRERVEVADVIAAAIETASPLLEEREHHLAVNVPRRGLVVDADPVRLGQVVANLLTNAAKYTPREGHVAVSAAREGDEVVVRVRDDGMGIDPAALPTLFDMFVQGRQPIDRSLGGLGLGLTIVRAFVGMHGGAVRAASEGPGRGSEFTVRLPAAAPADRASRPAESAARDEAGRRQVLVVDDNEDAADMLAIYVRAMGHEARVAHDAPSALAAVRTFAPDVALLDIGLPVMDGYELARRLRERVGAMRLIAITGYGQEADRRRSMDAGFDAHLVKPVDLSVLERLLDDVSPPR